MNEEEPQSRQIRTLGNTKTPTSSAFLRSGKWMFTSAGYSVWLLEPQFVQAMVIPPKVLRHVELRMQVCRAVNLDWGSASEFVLSRNRRVEVGEGQGHAPTGHSRIYA